MLPVRQRLCGGVFPCPNRLGLEPAANALGPGDTLYIRGGTHTFNEPTTFWNSGAAGTPIRVMNYGSEVAILRSPGFRLIETQASYINFESSGGSYNLKLTDASYGISVAMVSSHIKITGLEIYGMRQNPVLLEGANGIMLLAVSDMEVSGCFIHDNGNDWHEHGVYMEGGSRIVIAGNIIAHNAGWGVHGYGPDSGGDGPVIEKNIVYGNGSNYNGTAQGSGIIISESWRNAIVRNNFCYGNKVHGIQVESWDEGGTPPTNTIIVNNTVFHNGDAEIRIANANGTKIYNNILYDGSGGLMISAGSALTDLASDYNLFHLIGAASFDDVGNLRSFTEWKAGRNVDGNSITGDPLFVNLPASNAHLLAQSPAVDRGSPNFAPADDIDGESRPQGGGVEIGADELATAPSGIVGPLIQANGSTNNISINRGTDLSVTVQLNPGEYAGTNVDWWVVARANSSWFYLDSSRQW
ncbi:MAG: right-handed parallel beta-helix repeat-containing protein, partial [Lentisphaerae bacterium]|nr:right-handed parallel beta-helix repeat-containing protein [Lentisphaerota bacterium]